MRYRSIHSSFWRDPFIESQPPEVKLIYLFLITACPTQCGIFEVTLERISFETGYPIDTVSEVVDTLSAKKKISRRGNFTLIFNFLKYQASSSPKIIKKIQKELQAFEDFPNIIEEFAENWEKLPISKKYPIDTVLIGYGRGIVKKRKEKKRKKNKKHIVEGSVETPKFDPSTDPDSFEIAEMLKSIIQAKKNVKINSQRLISWAKEIRKLKTVDGVSWDRIKKAMTWYTENAYGEFVPVIESGKTLRNKFLKLEGAMERDKTAGNKNSNTNHIPPGSDCERYKGYCDSFRVGWTAKERAQFDTQGLKKPGCDEYFHRKAPHIFPKEGL